MPPPVFRFAPSPNGYLHLGHAYSALLNFDLARRTGGRFLLRIEDIDVTRCRPEFEAAIYEDLAWLGISWETPVRRQSEHFANYRDALEKLAGLGLIYPSFESRAEIARLAAQREGEAPWPRDPDGVPLYPGAAKSLPPDPRAQGDAHQLSSVRRDRRRLAGRHGCGARPGPVLVDQRASSVAAAARYSATGLSASSAGCRFVGAKVVEIDGRHRLARIARAG